MDSLPRKTHDRKITICETCNGRGTTENSKLIDYHRGEYKYWNEVCINCKGSGRMITIIDTVTEVKPYDNAEVSLLLLKQTNDK